tara:strand:- start:609 stop:1001 length:393 start_codon:yes stop_codon:yes gene_type:complete
MANFDLGNTAATVNNPIDWLSPYGYNATADGVTIDLTSVLSDVGVADADLQPTTGDVRSVYLALAEALYKAYDAKDDAAATTSNRLKVTRSRVVDDTNNIRYSTYTIHIQEDGVATDASFASTGVREENP